MTNPTHFFSRLFRRPRLAGLLCGLTLTAAQFFTGAGVDTAQAAATTTCTPNGTVQNCTVTFAYTGAAETWTVPEAVTQATFDLYGAQGGGARGGKGGRATATINVTTGTAYQIRVGGAGTASAINFVVTGGFNGGGNGSGYGGSGGGASDVRTSTVLTSRILVAGGGGGGYQAVATGGIGGNPSGGTGATPNSTFVKGGGGGTQDAGGAGGAFGNDVNYSGTAGALGQGGKNTMGGTGGGGGYYGGGGGGKMIDPINPAAGGGGGSSFGPAGATFQNGVRSGNGQIIITYTLQKTATTTTITSANPNPSVVGQAVPVAFTVTPIAAGTGAPTGNVTITDGTNACTATVAAGQCSLPFTSSGAKTLKATYAGDAKFTGSTSANVVHTVNKAETTTTITANTPNPSTVGQAVAVSYSVVANAPGAGTPTGNVTVSDGVTSCTATVAAGSCQLTLSSYGNQVLKATYAGDGNFNPSTSSDVSQIVNQNDTTTTITADDPDPSVVGQAVIVKYTVTPATATGNVAVTSDDGVDSCTGTVAAGQCTLTFTSAGAKLLTATYVGDDNFFPSNSAPVQHTVNPGAAAVAAAAKTNAVTSTQPLTSPAVAAAPAITPSVPVSAPAPVAAAPVVTTTQPVTPTAAAADTGAAAPADANAPAAPATTEQNQRFFLPLITKLAGAAFGSPGGIAVLVLLVLIIGGLVWQRRRSRTGR